jgi:hypothetical protein
MRMNTESIVVGLFLLVLIFVGPGEYLDHSINHDFPYGYGASDSFQHQIRAESIKDMGNFRYEATYIAKGFEGVVGRYPPVLYHLAVSLSIAAGIEVYDAIYFMLFFFGSLAVVLMYLIIREYHKMVALLSLPLGMLIFSFPPSLGFYWGHWPSLLSQVFLVLLFWGVLRSDLEGAYVLIAAAFGAIVMTHTSEAIFGGVFLLLYFLHKIVSRSLDKQRMMNVGIGISIAIVISSYFLVIFMNTWAKAQPYHFSVIPVWNGNPGFYLTGFGLILIVLALGLMVSLFKMKESSVATLLGMAMLISGYMNYVGFDFRSFQLRFFWPIYFMVFFGLGLYMLLKLVPKEFHAMGSIAIVVVFVSLFSGMFSLPVLAESKTHSIPASPSVRGLGQGMLDTYHWEAFKWIEKNTKEDAKIYFFYGDIYGNDAVLRNSKRFHAQVDPQGFVSMLQERKIAREYLSELPGDNGGIVAIRTGMLSFENIESTKPQEYYFGKKDVCEFDYFVFDRVSRQEPLAQYNMIIASELEKMGSKAVFANNAIVIVENGKIGGDCIAETSF